MHQARYWISELADVTGVSTRTIRYYIEEGLLPSPEIQGKYSIFDEEYVIRLRLIKFLKEAYLPLREIKLLLDQWDMGQMLARLSEFEQDPFHAARNLRGLISPNLPSPDREAKESAAEYLSQVMQSPRRLNRSESAQTPAHHKKIRNQFEELQAQYLKMESTPAAESWQRYKIVEDVELWVRQPISSDMQQKLDWFMEQARNLFSKREENEDGTDEGLT